MTQDSNDSGPWYNPENLNSQNNGNAGGNTNENANGFSNTSGNCSGKSKKDDDFLSENEDNFLVFGAISMVLGIFSLIGEKLILGILGLVFGKISEHKKRNNYAKVGIICSIISIAIGIISLVFVLVLFAIYGAALLDILKDAVQTSAV